MTTTNYNGDYEPQYIVRAGELLIGMDGEFRCFEWKGSQALLNQRVCKLIDFSSVLLPRFLLYGIDQHLKEIEDRTTFTTVKHLSSKTITSIKFQIPPLEEQVRIVAAIDEIVENLTEIRGQVQEKLKNTEELRQTLLQRAFAGELT